jgi:hypothetical protein
LGYSRQENDLRGLTGNRCERKKEQIKQRGVVVESVSIWNLSAKQAVDQMQMLRLVGIGLKLKDRQTTQPKQHAYDCQRNIGCSATRIRIGQTLHDRSASF